MSEAPIGVFDSGIGGLTVARELFWRLPNESILYVADTAHVPYGGRPTTELRRLAVALVEYLAEQGCKLVVAACNSSSAVALEAMRAAVPVPVLGVLDAGARAAVEAVEGGAVGVLATEATVASGAYPAAIARRRAGLAVYQAACPRFVPLVERMRLGTPDAYAAVCDHLAELPLRELGALVLGCTHYPFLAPLIRMRADERTHLVDPAGETAREVASMLVAGGLQASGSPRHRLQVTGDGSSLRQVNQLCFGGRLPEPEPIGPLVELQRPASDERNLATAAAGTATLMSGPVSVDWTRP